MEHRVISKSQPNTDKCRVCECWLFASNQTVSPTNGLSSVVCESTYHLDFLNIYTRACTHFMRIICKYICMIFVWATFPLIFAGFSHYCGHFFASYKVGTRLACSSISNRRRSTCNLSLSMPSLSFSTSNHSLWIFMSSLCSSRL